MQTSTHKKWEPFCWECDQDSRTPSLFVSYSHALTDTHTHTHTHRGHIMQWYSCFKQTYIQWSHITLRLFIDMPSLVHIVRRELMRKRVNPYEMHSFNSQTFIHILTKMLYETPDYCNKCLVTLKEWSREEQSDLNGRKEQNAHFVIHWRKKRGTRIQSFGDKPIRPWSCVECYACYS